MQKPLLKLVKLKAVALTAGLITLGVTNAAWAELLNCKSNTNTPPKDGGNKCQTKDYQYTTNEGCICPGYYESHTQKCKSRYYPQSGELSHHQYITTYSCQQL